MIGRRSFLLGQFGPIFEGRLLLVSGRVEVLLGFPSLQDRPAGRSVVPVLLPVVSGGPGLSQSETKVDS